MATKATKKKEVLTSGEEVKAKAVKPAAKKKAAAKKPAVKKAAVKKAPAKTAAKKEVKQELKTKTNKDPNAYLLIDYPVEGDRISCGHYAIRVGASPDGYVELSFNNGEWNPCRYDDGFWWFDWVYFTPGDYLLAARMVDANGNVVAETAPRKCKVC